jgi:hypothetical protein
MDYLLMETAFDTAQADSHFTSLLKSANEYDVLIAALNQLALANYQARCYFS